MYGAGCVVGIVVERIASCGDCRKYASSSTCQVQRNMLL